MVWSVDDDTVGDVSGDGTFYGDTLTGLKAGDVVVKAEVKYMVGQTATSFDPKIEDTITITIVDPNA